MKLTTKNPKNTKKGKWVRSKWPSRPEVFEAFSKWMAYPKSARDPKTQGAFAIKNEVSPDTLSDYKKKPEFWQKVEDKKQEIHSELVDNMLLAQIIWSDEN